MYHFDFSILWSEWGLRLLSGFGVTLRLFAVSLVFALLIGLVVGAARWVGGRVLGPLCWLYIEFARDTPPLVQILFWYFSSTFILPAAAIAWLRGAGLEFVAAVVALSLYHGAFIAEVFRAGFNAVPKGQYDGARAIGLSFPQMMRYVVLPQALRVVIPPLTNEAVSLAKNTSLALAIGVTELAYQTKYVDVYTFRGIEALIAATVLYLILCLAVALCGDLLGRRISPHARVRHELGFGLD